MKKLIALMAGLAAGVAGAATWYVSTEGSDESTGGTTVQTAFRTLEKALTKAGDGDTVRLVKSAVAYPVSAEQVLSTGITIQGDTGNPADVTVQRPSTASAKYRVFKLDHANAVLRDLTIAGGYTQKDGWNGGGGGVFITENGGRVEHCVVVDCKADYWNPGGGIAIAEKSSAVVDRCVIRNCTNRAYSDVYGGSAIAMKSGTVRNSLLVGNHQTSDRGILGGTVRIDGGVLENCTIVANDSPLCAGVWAKGGGTVRNCLIGANTSTGLTDPAAVNWAGLETSFTNCVSDAEINDWCRREDAIFESPDDDRWQPKVGSAAVDGAADEEWMNDALDLAGVPRHQGVAADVGCYERDPNAFAASVRTGKTAGLDPLTVSFEVMAQNAAGSVSCQWDWNGDGEPEETKDGLSASHEFGVGEHQVRVTVVAGGQSFTVPGFVRVFVAPRTIAVAAGESIPAAIAQAADGTEIVLGMGTHPVSAAIAVNKGVIIRSADETPGNVILHSDGKEHQVFILNHAQATVAGVVIENSYGKSTGSFGAGVRIDRLGGIVSNCLFRSCKLAGWSLGGGAIGIAAGADSALVTHCVFTDCTAPGDGYNSDYPGGGGAIAMRAGTVRNSLFCKNVYAKETKTAGYHYGTVRIDGGVLENCTFAENSAGSCAGVWARGGTVRNCLFGENKTTVDPDANLPVWAGTADCFEKCVADVEINGSCTVVTHPFVYAEGGDYSPRAGIAAVDGATVFDWMTGATDLAGNARIRGDGPDIGCYEIDPDAFSASFEASSGQDFVPADVTYTVTTANAGALGVTCEWDFDGNGVYEEKTDSLTITHRFTELGDYAVSLRVTDKASNVTFTVPSAAVFKAMSKTVYVVKDNPDAAYPYGTPATAAATVADALTAAGDDIEVVIDKGVYPVKAELLVDKGVTIRGATGNPEDVELRSDGGNHRLLRLRHASAKVLGLVISNAKVTTQDTEASGGVGVRIENPGGMVSNCVIRNCTIGNWNRGGGGVCIAKDAAAALVTHCVISNCFDDCGKNCNSDWTGGGGAIAMLDGTVRNCLIVKNVREGATGNTSCWYGTVRIDGGLLENCTIADNSAGTCAGVWARGGTVKDCVIAQNKATFDTAENLPVWAGKTEVFVGCGTDRHVNDGCLDVVDPFTDAAHGDYSLAAGSTLINAGTASAWMTGATDLAGNDRIRGEAPDVGCYEADPDAFSASFVASAAYGFAPVSVTYTVTPVNSGASGVICSWDWNGDGIVDETSSQLEITHRFDGYGVFDVKLSVQDKESGISVAVPGSKSFASLPKTMYVAKDNAGAAYPFATEPTAAACLADALAAAEEDVEIVVAPEVYPVTAEITVEKGVVVRGATGNPEDVVLRSDGKDHRILDIRHANATVSGLTVENGSLPTQKDGNIGAGVRIEQQGGTVSNCIVRGCSVGNWNRGGGGIGIMQGATSALVTHCVISNCTEKGTSGNCNNDWMGGGGAIAMYAGTVRNCLVTKNVRETATGQGVCFYGTVRMDGGTLENCTVVDNAAGSCAGVWARSACTVRNCIIAGNRTTVDAGTQLPVWAGLPASFVNCVADREINADCSVEAAPFRNAAAGDYYPALLEAVVDAAAHQDWMDGATDLDGNPRVLGDEADLGCYELEAEFSAGAKVGDEKGLVPYAARFTATVANAGDAGAALYWTWGDEGDIEHETEDLTATHVYEKCGVYTARLRVVARSSGEEAVATVKVSVLPKILWVSPACAGSAEPYATRETAATNIADAVALAIDGCEVRLTDGVHPVTSEIGLAKPILVIGETGRPEDVVLRRADTQAHRVVSLKSSAATLASLTVENGYLENDTTIAGGCGAGVFLSDLGGVVSNVVVRDCRIKTWSMKGGGVYIDAPASDDVVQLVTHTVVTNCQILNHSGTDRAANGGYGLFAAGGTVRNSLFVGNRPFADDNVSDLRRALGGAVAMGGRAVMANCTVVSNMADNIAGVQVIGANVQVQNCIIAGNVSTSGTYPSERAFGGEPSCFDHCVADVEINLLCRTATADEIFRRFPRGDYRPGLHSPARDFGRTYGWMTGATDLKGNPRVFNKLPDVGCYESQSGGLMLLVK